MKVVDGFIFYNELDMLEVRLTHLNPVVDYFVLVESTVTFRNNAKVLYYNENKSRYAQWAHKIIHVIVSDMHTVGKSAWDREHYQRRCILKGIAQISSLKDEDLIFINDVDEIMDPLTVQKAVQDKLSTMNSLELDVYTYNVNSKHRSKWYHAKVVPYGKFISVYNGDTETLRHSTPEGVIRRAGWHFSYFGDEKFVSNKIKQFSHSEFDLETYTNTNLIQERISKNIDPFDRDTIHLDFVTVEDNNYMPSDIVANLERFFPVKHKEIEKIPSIILTPELIECKVLYGASLQYRDVTPILKEKIDSNVMYSIPQSDELRAVLFDGDHLPGVEKHILLCDRYNVSKYVFINQPLQLKKEDGIISAY